MSVDFSLILVVATLVSGLIWGAYALVQRRRAEQKPDGEKPAEPTVVEYARSFFPILLLVLVIRSFIYEPFRIPSSSMMPTLLVGDFIFVNKYVYGLRLPVTNTKIVATGEPKRGDVIVFRLPSDPGTNFIKRLVGLPGDTIRYVNKRLYINDQPVEVSIKGRYDGSEQSGAVLAHERLGSVEHDILLVPGRPTGEGVFVVPDGHFFMMGDNRDNSHDSRYQEIGFIPENRVVGKAVRIWMNWNFGTWPLWARIGSPIR
jgi:signal peptidase I